MGGKLFSFANEIKLPERKNAWSEMLDVLCLWDGACVCAFM